MSTPTSKLQSVSALSYKDQMLIWRRRRERAQALRANGLTLAEIADQLQCSKQRVHQLLGKGRKS